MEGQRGEPLLQVEGVNTLYGRAHILHDMALGVERGEVVVLLGRNGAGKSTTLKTIMGLVRPASGHITYDGRPIAGMPTHKICHLGLGYVPEDRRIFGGLTVMENLETGRQPPREGYPRWTVERLFELFPNLATKRTQQADRMSGGEQQMLSISRTLMGNPAMMLLDEPSEGLAPVIVEHMARTVLELKRGGLTIVLSEQNLRFAMLVSDRAYIIEKGHIRYQGTMSELRSNPEVLKAYLMV